MDKSTHTGKDRSRTTVTVPQVGVTTGVPVVISGTVTDVSAGASQDVVKADFPNGLPCVSEDSMRGLMEAAYEQQPLPTNLTGVPVNIYVLDSNNNYRQIGTTTSDASGTFSYTWKPDIPGDFTVYAVFAGSNGYWPSSADAHLYANPVQQQPHQQQHRSVAYPHKTHLNTESSQSSS